MHVDERSVAAPPAGLPQLIFRARVIPWMKFQPRTRLTGECHEAARTPWLAILSEDFHDAAISPCHDPFFRPCIFAWRRCLGGCRDARKWKRQKTKTGPFAERTADWRTQYGRSDSSCLEPPRVWSSARGRGTRSADGPGQVDRRTTESRCDCRQGAGSADSELPEAPAVHRQID